MKKIILSLLISCTTIAYSQVIIGDQTGTATNKTAVLLDFASGQNKGIILPYVRVVPSQPTPGTMILDASDANNASVKYYNGTWNDLSSGNKANISLQMTAQPGTSVTESSSAKVIIGANSSSAPGVLVLESTQKVMVLPQVNQIGDIQNPAPGMMVYVNKSGAKRLAVFNGAKWTYWGPN